MKSILERYDTNTLLGLLIEFSKLPEKYEAAIRYRLFDDVNYQDMKRLQGFADEQFHKSSDNDTKNGIDTPSKNTIGALRNIIRRSPGHSHLVPLLEKELENFTIDSEQKEKDKLYCPVSLGILRIPDNLSISAGCGLIIMELTAEKLYFGPILSHSQKKIIRQFTQTHNPGIDYLSDKEAQVRMFSVMQEYGHRMDRSIQKPLKG